MGVFVAAGEPYTVENTGDEELVLVSVTAPQVETPSPNGHRAVRWSERPSLPARPNREFRYLVDAETGCRDITQFVGVIPPGRAPMHSHTYDEVIYVVEGQGVLHLGGRDTPIRQGNVHPPAAPRRALPREHGVRADARSRGVPPGGRPGVARHRGAGVSTGSNRRGVSASNAQIRQEGKV
jgi:mannose-6-phosphate isomerase-like protein (cupin superfamily)